jgi:4-hydroxy-tetrahydrodipicolinate reductase
MSGSKKINIGIFASDGRMSREVIKEIEKSDQCKVYYQYSKTSGVLSDLMKSDVVIDFSTREASLDLIKEALVHKTKIICGTTGFTNEEFEYIKKASESIPILYSRNMSLGINIVKHIIGILSMNLEKGFDIDIIDIHHKAKKDSPSGTAFLLKESLQANKEVNIVSLRSGNVAGTHEIYFSGQDEQIMIKHQAFSRRIFAAGAIQAACFLHDCQKPSLYSMDDVIKYKI